MHDFVAAWRGFKPNGAPHVLADDKAALLDGPGALASYRDRTAYEAAIASGQESRTALHLGLLPQPFHGRIEDAAVYLVALNPGFRPEDYAVESERPELREALLAEYSGKSPVLFLDPRFDWHPGYDWWLNKTCLRDTIKVLGNRAGIDTAAAQAYVAENVAVLQLLPYHSSGFRRRSMMDQLRSVALARSFLNDCILPKARRGECAVVVLWGNGNWQVQPEPDHGIVVQGGINGKRLGPGTAGGKLMIERLLARRQEPRA